MQLAAQIEWQIGGLIGVVLLQKFNFVTNWLTQMAGLFDESTDFFAFRRSGHIDFDTCSAYRGSRDDIGRLDPVNDRKIPNRPPFALRDDALELNQSRHTTLQSATRDAGKQL